MSMVLVLIIDLIMVMDFISPKYDPDFGPCNLSVFLDIVLILALVPILAIILGLIILLSCSCFRSFALP